MRYAFSQVTCRVQNPNIMQRCSSRRTCVLYTTSLSCRLKHLSQQPSVPCHSRLYTFLVTHALPWRGPELPVKASGHHLQRCCQQSVHCFSCAAPPPGYSATWHMGEGAGGSWQRNFGDHKND